jgi:FMN phosphatase YigB (HAD superfamily)
MQQPELYFDQIQQARARRDAGMASSARHAEQDAPGWLESAVAEVHRYAHAVYPADFTIEEARASIEHNLQRPPELRAWGAVTRACKARGLIEAVEGVWRCAASSNGSPKQVYRLRRAW